MVLLSLTAASAAGPLVVSHRDLRFDDPDQGVVSARLYYPALDPAPGASPAGGPYPLVAFLHGYLGTAAMYDDLCEALAGQGFVVASTDTESGLFLDRDAFAADTVAVLHHVEDGAGLGWVDLVDRDAPLGAVGHSMGGATLPRLVELEPRIDTLVGLMAYDGDRDADYDVLAGFEGAAMFVAGTDDLTAPPRMTDDWFASVEGARGLAFVIEGAGHLPALDSGLGDLSSLGHEAAHAVVRDLVLAFVDAELHGDEDRYRDLIGPGAPEGVLAEVGSRSGDPALWADLVGDRIEMGVSARPDDLVTVWVGASDDLAGATALAVDLPTIDGWLQGQLDVPPGWDEDLWIGVEVGVDPTRTSRTVLLREGSATATTSPDPGSAGSPGPGTDPAPPGAAQQAEAVGLGAGCACAAGRVTPAGWLVVGLLAVAAGRRRRLTRGRTDRAIRAR